MKNVLKGIYYFLPVQLLLLSFRKYQLLLVFWLILFATITGNFAEHFGASSLFLTPEYLGHINFVSMLLLGCAMAVFVMTWNITTFIINSKRIPYMGATRQTFLIYCLNNFLLPLIFLTFYSLVTIRFQLYNEHTPVNQVLILQLGFYLGFLLVLLLSFTYFFRVSRDLLKTVLSKITNPSVIREIIPYDSLDYETDIIRADTYISGRLKIKRCSELESYHPRLLNTVLRRHHRNAVFATVFSYILLLLMGIFMNNPALRVPAGASFLLFFSIIMGVAGAVKYFLKSWETLGWIIFISLVSLLVKYKVFDLRSIAYGIEYHGDTNTQPTYKYEYLHHLFTPQRYAADKKLEEQRLTNWKNKFNDTTASKPPLIVLTVSGGGSRSAYWTFRALQYVDSITNGKLFNNTVMITGASGGMIGAAYWRSIHSAYLHHEITNPYSTQYQENIGKDLLNAIIFSLASVDLISPFNKISISGKSHTKDRGYALEQELVRNTDGVLGKNIGDYKQDEATGSIPQMIINSTIINDGRKLMISAQPLTYLTQAEYTLTDTATPVIDAIDFGTFFSKQKPDSLRLTSALRMNATFPFILPVVKLPSHPSMDVMDAGLRDNFGTEVASRYLYVLRDWLKENTSKVVFLEIRDTREYDVLPSTNENSLGSMLSNPLFVIQSKWEAFQSYNHGYMKDYAPYFLDGKLRFVTLQYVPEESKKIAALNFHLTQREKEDLYNSIHNTENQAAIDTLLQLIK